MMKKSSESGIKHLTEDEENIVDKQSIAEILNLFFVDQPKKLQSRTKVLGR